MLRSAVFVLALALATAACGPDVDLTKALQVTVVSSGWYDAGIVNGQNKLVPAVTVTVKNISDRTLSLLQVNSLFRQVNAAEEWGSAFLTAAGSEGLGPGATKTVTLRSNNGYTGSGETRQQMLANTHFVDAKVEIFAKYGSTQWKKMGDFPITRQLLEKS
jgi:hypothetical protein